MTPYATHGHPMGKFRGPPGSIRGHLTPGSPIFLNPYPAGPGVPVRGRCVSVRERFVSLVSRGALRCTGGCKARSRAKRPRVPGGVRSPPSGPRGKGGGPRPPCAGGRLRAPGMVHVEPPVPAGTLTCADSDIAGACRESSRFPRYPCGPGRDPVVTRSDPGAGTEGKAVSGPPVPAGTAAWEDRDYGYVS